MIDSRFELTVMSLATASSAVLPLLLSALVAFLFRCRGDDIELVLPKKRFNHFAISWAPTSAFSTASAVEREAA
jgi:hypothetical protein